MALEGLIITGLQIRLLYSGKCPGHFGVCDLGGIQCYLLLSLPFSGSWVFSSPLFSQSMFYLFFQSVLVGEVLISTVNVTHSVSHIPSSHCLVKSFFFFLLALSASELDVLLEIRSSNCLSTEVNQIARTVSDAGYYLKCLMCLLHGDKISVIFKACLRNVLSKLDSHSTWGKCLLFIVWLSAT